MAGLRDLEIMGPGQQSGPPRGGQSTLPLAI